MKLKSQVSLEYIMILGILLVITIPIFYYAITKSNANIKLSQADDAVNVIARTADSVYSLGEGSKNYIWVTIPSGVVSTSIENNIVEIKLNIFGGVSDIYAETKANVTGTLPSSRGTYKILIEAVSGGQVAVFYYNDTSAPNVVSTSPSGLMMDNDTTLIAITDENAVCNYDLNDVEYDSMGNAFSGTAFTHQSYAGQLSEGKHVYYVRCKDSSGNNMTSSAKINFTINLSSDITPPSVTKTAVDDGSVLFDEYVCINTTVEDNSSISWVKVMLTSPLEDPFITVHNYSASDTGPSCSGTADDNIYGVDAQMQAVGTWYVNTAYAMDSEGNTGEEMPHPDLQINVTESFVGDLTYRPVSEGIYFKTSDLALPDSNPYFVLTDQTSDLVDDDKNTPAASYKFKLSGGTYEGFVFGLDDPVDMYSIIKLRIKVESSDVLPYNLIAYAYASDGDSVSMIGYTGFAITNIKSEANRGENEVDLTSTLRNASYSYIKVRVAPTPDMDGKRADITEADFGVW